MQDVKPVPQTLSQKRKYKP